MSSPDEKYQLSRCSGLPLSFLASSESPAVYAMDSGDAAGAESRLLTTNPAARDFLRQPTQQIAAWKQRIAADLDSRNESPIRAVLHELIPRRLIIYDCDAWFDSTPEGWTLNSEVASPGDIRPGCVLSVFKPHVAQVTELLNGIGLAADAELVGLLQLLNGFCEALPIVGGRWIDLSHPPNLLHSEEVDGNYGNYFLEPEWNPALPVFLASTSEPLLLNRCGEFGWWRWQTGEPIVRVARSAAELEQLLLPCFESIVDNPQSSPFDRPWLNPYDA